MVKSLFDPSKNSCIIAKTKTGKRIAMNSHKLDKEQIHQIVEQIQLKVISIVKSKNDYEFQCVAGGATSIENNIVMMQVYMNEENMKLPKRVSKKINQLFIEELKKNTLKLKVEVNEGKYNESPFAPMANQHYSRFLISLLNALDVKYLDWLKLIHHLNNVQILELLKEFTSKAFFSNELRQFIKNDKNYSTALKTLTEEIYEEYADIHKKYNNVLYQTSTRLSNFINMDESITEDQTFCFSSNKIIQYITQDTGDYMDNWSRLRTVNTLTEFCIIKYNKFLNQIYMLQRKLTYIENACLIKDKIFTGIPVPDQVRLTGNSSLILDFPCVESVIDVYNVIVSLEESINISLKSTENTVNHISHHISKTIRPIENNANEKKVEIKSQPVLNTNESSDSKTNTTDYPIHNNSFGFFSPPSSGSITSEIKANALQKIKEIERREEKHRNRNKCETLSIAPTEMETNNEFIISVTLSDQNQEFNIFPLKTTKHIYICPDIDSIFSDANKCGAFKAIIGDARLLSQDSLGQNGIKLYGLDLMVVKCKAYNNERLLFTAHRIHHTNNYVFLCDGLVSHKEYELLLNNPKLLKKRAQEIKNKISINAARTIESNENEVSLRISFK